MSRWEQIRELFEEARTVSAEELGGWLERRCPDPELRAEVASLISHRDDAFLEQPEHLRPSRIGPYKILDELGSGGMGVVFLAEQQRPVQREVALKVIQQGMVTRQVLARFDAERQALALMSHPNIARVYDAGATEQGRPYFVMEYVKGVPILEHCDRHRLGGRRRLELFIDVCEGLQHAHQKGIIHRDIKSSNVLVAIEGERVVPKIIDFGIAKAIDRRLTEATAHTELGQILGTPEYMSPEQAEMTGQDIDTRSDIYSLGVLLYVLLVGAYPFDAEELHGLGFDELRRRIREVDPPRPSTRFTSLGERRDTVSRERETDPGSFARELRGDLDWIVMKALEKDRTRRYASAAEFAADIRRYLGNEPVLARPPGTGYRVGKFVRRHRLGVAAAGVVLAALLLGVVGTTAGMLRARSAERAARVEARTSEQVIDFLLHTFANADPEAARLEDVSAEEILAAGRERIAELDDQPRVQARLAREIGKIYRTRGDLDGSRALLEDALRYHRRLGDELELLKSINQLAVLEAVSHRYDAAEPLYREALALSERRFGPDHDDVAVTLKNLGDCRARLGDLDEARALHERAVAIREAADSPKLGQSLSSLADVYVRQEDYAAAVPLLERALEERQRHEPAGHYRIGLGHFFLANALRGAGRTDEAEEHFRRALQILSEAYPETHEHIRNAAFELARVLQADGRDDEALPLFARALRIDEANYGENHEYLVETLEPYAVCLRALGRDSEAQALQARSQGISKGR